MIDRIANIGNKIVINFNNKLLRSTHLRRTRCQMEQLNVVQLMESYIVTVDGVITSPSQNQL